MFVDNPVMSICTGRVLHNLWLTISRLTGRSVSSLRALTEWCCICGSHKTGFDAKSISICYVLLWIGRSQYMCCHGIVKASMCCYGVSEASIICVVTGGRSQYMLSCMEWLKPVYVLPWDSKSQYVLLWGIRSQYNMCCYGWQKPVYVVLHGMAEASICVVMG